MAKRLRPLRKWGARLVWAVWNAQKKRKARAGAVDPGGNFWDDSLFWNDSENWTD